MTELIDKNRLYWASRRGMLELDLVLVPFFEQCYDDLSDADKRCYMKLIDGEDTDLFQWCLGRSEPEDPELAHIIRMIVKHARTPKRLN